MPTTRPTALDPEQRADTSTLLRKAADLLTEHGIWRAPASLAAPEGYPDRWDPLLFAGAGPATGLDPLAALWLAAHGTLPYIFTTPTLEAIADAMDMVTGDPRTAAAVTALSDSLLAAGSSTDPIERIAFWVESASDLAVIGCLLRLAEELAAPAPTTP
ncbi:hypothetical protein ABTX81_30345 [Kitasatospora sp. NPDC097605]|uniref:hypothetical protein n=1 Tax=Kitasatospora sp. NPDC097605 TaxID=3157226 RepID=UPI003326F549